MKKIIGKIRDTLFTILMSPFLLLAMLLLVVLVPIDFIRYRASAFYRDTKQKYELFQGRTDWIRLYGLMRRDDLPLDFHLRRAEDGTTGHFRYRDILLVQDCPAEYAPDRDEWLVLYDEDDHEPCTPLSEALEMSLDDFRRFTGEALCTRAVLLVDAGDLPEEALPHLTGRDILPYQGKKDLSRALKAWIETMN